MRHVPYGLTSYLLCFPLVASPTSMTSLQVCAISASTLHVDSLQQDNKLLAAAVSPQVQAPAAAAAATQPCRCLLDSRTL